MKHEALHDREILETHLETPRSQIKNFLRNLFQEDELHEQKKKEANELIRYILSHPNKKATYYIDKLTTNLKNRPTNFNIKTINEHTLLVIFYN